MRPGQRGRRVTLVTFGKASTPMGEAIFGLIGVLVGGIITAGSSYLLDRRREMLEALKDSQNRQIELKRASRLIDAELSLAEAEVKSCMESRRTFSQHVHLPIEDWEQYRASVAPELTDDEWLALRVAMEAVRHIQMTADRFPESDLSDEVEGAITFMLLDIQKGREALSRFTLDAKDTPEIAPTPGRWLIKSKGR